MPQLLDEFRAFLAAHKRYWIAPIILVILLFAVVLALSRNVEVTPFIYTLF